MKFTLTIFTILFLFKISGQSIIFQQIYQCQTDQSAKEAIEISSGGYMIAAMNEKSFGDTDIYILRTDINGDTIWTKSFGGNFSEYPNMILETTGGNFLILGYTKSFGAGNNDIYLIKIDINGNILWTKSYGDIGDDEGKDIIATTDGNYMITGRSNSPGNLNYDAFLKKIDPNGNILWENNYGGNQYETSRSVKECIGGGYIIAGQTNSYGSGNGDVFLVRTDANGNFQWSKTFGGSNIDDGNAVIENADSSIIIAAETNSYGSGNMDVWVIKTDKNGNVVWDQTFGGIDKDVSKTMRPTSDGGYIIGAISRSFGWINPEMWLIKIDANGILQWTRSFGSWDHEHCHSAREVSDGGFISVGHSKSYGPVSKIMFIKLDQNGTTNLNTNKTQNTFKIYPNPFQNTIKFSYKTENEEEIKISLYGVDQKYIYQKIIKENNIVDNEIIATSELSSGIYFITAESKKEKIIRKVIKQ